MTTNAHRISARRAWSAAISARSSVVAFVVKGRRSMDMFSFVVVVDGLVGGWMDGRIAGFIVVATFDDLVLFDRWRYFGLICRVGMRWKND